MFNLLDIHATVAHQVRHCGSFNAATMFYNAIKPSQALANVSETFHEACHKLNEGGKGSTIRGRRKLGAFANPNDKLS